MNSFDFENTKKEWTLQLRREFEEICFHFRVPLKIPFIHIVDLKSRWGSWESQTRTLSIATRLITDYSWSTVLQVFKHEIAHQYVDEIIAIQEDPHGPSFKQACEILGVEKWAQKSEIHSSVLLADLSHPSKSPEEEALLRRIERLLALSQSTNEHEALAAMNKVSELHEKYKISQLSLESSDEFKTHIIDHKVRRLASFHGSLASILINYFSVHVVFSSLYDKDTQSSHKIIEILGRPESVQLAEYVYWFLYNTLKVLWKQYKERTNVQGVAAKNTYYLGVLKGFDNKMQNSKKERTEQITLASNEKSLVRLEQKRLDDYLKSRHPRLHTARSTRRTCNAKIFQDGVVKGKDLCIHEGLKASKSGAAMKFLDWPRS